LAIPAEPRDYGCPVRNDPTFREPRWPAILIWTASGLFLGLAVSIIGGLFPVPLIVGGVIGLAVGLFLTRVKYVPEDD
jgi:hypothetical protein